MAWLSSGRSQADLVQNLFHGGVIKSNAVKQTMLAVDRGFFSPMHPYTDSPQPIGYNATISAPHMHAYALEVLHDKLKEGARVLDIGSGTGYLTACFAVMVGKMGKVVGVEHIPELAKQSIHNIERWNSEVLKNGVIKIFAADGRLGYPSEGPYDAIHVGAAAPRIPEELLDQLAPGGRMILPVGAQFGNQSFTQVDKSESGKCQFKELMGVMYVPLTDKQKQLHDEF